MSRPLSDEFGLQMFFFLFFIFGVPCFSFQPLRDAGGCIALPTLKFSHFYSLVSVFRAVCILSAGCLKIFYRCGVKAPV